MPVSVSWTLHSPGASLPQKGPCPASLVYLNYIYIYHTPPTWPQMSSFPCLPIPQVQTCPVSCFQCQMLLEAFQRPLERRGGDTRPPRMPCSPQQTALGIDCIDEAETIPLLRWYRTGFLGIQWAWHQDHKQPGLKGT